MELTLHVYWYRNQMAAFDFVQTSCKLNAVTKSDSFPILRIDDCIDKIGHAKFVSKLDLLKGFWQVSLTEQAKKLSKFVTLKGLYQSKIMPFGMKNAPAAATFRQLINSSDGYIRGHNKLPSSPD